MAFQKRRPSAAQAMNAMAGIKAIAFQKTLDHRPELVEPFASFAGALQVALEPARASQGPYADR